MTSLKQLADLALFTLFILALMATAGGIVGYCIESARLAHTL